MSSKTETKPVQEDTGTDIKSIAINLASTFLMALPIALYTTSAQYKYEMFAGLVASFALAYVLPPVGWRRPHPYSDDINNRPIKRA